MQRGFTLIELSIVLVIIGLIAGGVLVGRDMIEAAKIRAQVSQIEEIQTAMNTFRLKYNCLPGDCAHATTFGLGTNGDGNKKLAEIGISWAGESNRFWSHMEVARLLQLPISANDAIRQSTFGAGVTFYVSKAGLYSGQVPTAYHSTNGLVVADVVESIAQGGSWRYGAFDAPTAYQLETKIDDGLPLTGKIIAYDGTGRTCLSGSAYDLTQTHRNSCWVVYWLD